ETEDESEEARSSNDTVAVSDAGDYGAAGSVVSAAMAQIGVNQDCTMLVSNALRAAGIYFHGWPAGYFSLGSVVSAAAAQPGDLIYYADGGAGWAHIALYVGGGRAVHGGWKGYTTVLASAYISSASAPVFIRLH
ncbi:MAG: NlpC/P60 family protein, partial [Breznakia sp.]